MKSPAKTLSAIAIVLALAPTAQASDWYFRAGPSYVDPKSDNGSLANGALTTTIDSQLGLGLVLGRRLTPNFAVELLAATPFEHTVALNGTDAVDFKHLPPTLSAVYTFMPDARVRPFVGAGVNYTVTFEEREYGPLAGTEVSIGNSWGLAAQAGLNVKVNERWDVTFDVRWLDIDADVNVNGARVGSTEVEPVVVGVHLGYQF